METPRVRRRGSFASSSTHTFWAENYTGCTPKSATVQNIGLDICQGTMDTITDYVTPGFFRRKAKGEIFPTRDMSMVHEESNILDPGHGWKYSLAPTCNPPLTTRGWIDGFQMGDLIGGSNLAGTPGVSVVPALTDREILLLAAEVNTKCLASRGTADSNLFESVAEINQTLDLLRHPFRSFWKVLTDPKRNALSKLAKTSGDAWLVYRYGIMPIIRDVTSILEGAGKGVGKRRKTTRTHQTIRRDQVFSRSKIDGATQFTFDIQTFDSVEVRAFSLDEYIADFFSNIGFTAKGLITLPWELIPYSFVADWFINAGDVIGAFTPAPGYKQLASGVVINRETTSIYTAGSTVLTGGFILERPITGSCRAYRRSKTRQAMGGPTFLIKNDFRFDSATRVADAMALIAQKLDTLVRKG